MNKHDLFEMQEDVVADVEALRHDRRNDELEDGLSIKDWVDRVAKATKQAARLARQDPQLEYEAWSEVGEIVLGRMEQIRRLTVRRECEHEWGDELEPHSQCLKGCGLMYGELSE